MKYWNIIYQLEPAESKFFVANAVEGISIRDALEKSVKLFTNRVPDMGAKLHNAKCFNKEIDQWEYLYDEV